MMVNRLTRYAQIAAILSKYGFGIFLQQLYPDDRRPDFLKPAEMDREDVYRRIRLAIEELGPTFIKLGQILSVRRDVLPPQLIDELLVLTDDVTPVPFEDVKTIVEETCGDVDQFCIFVDPEPFAAASLSQVHRATLTDGSDVVFKIQRPNIRELIEVDLTILENLAERAEKTFPYLRPFNPVGLIDEFSQQMRKELDFIRDGKNAETIAENLKTIPEVKIPKIYWEYSSPRVLVMEYVEGTRIDNVDELSKKFDTKALAEIGFKAYIQQIFVDGFFHGDPHPGNLRVTDDGKLVFLDFGMVGILRPERRLAYTRTMYSIVSNDIDMLIDSFEDLDISIETDEIDRFKDEMYAIMRETQRYELGDYSFIDSMNELTSVFYRYRVQMPGSFMLMIKVIAMIGDIGILLDPSFNFMDRIEPYLSQMLASSFFSTESLEETRQTLAREILGFPKALRKFLERFSSGKSKMEVTISEFDQIQTSVNEIARKLFLGLLAMGLIIGLSILIAANPTILAEWIELIIMVAGVILIITILKGISGTSEYE